MIVTVFFSLFLVYNVQVSNEQCQDSQRKIDSLLSQFFFGWADRATARERNGA